MKAVISATARSSMTPIGATAGAATAAAFPAASVGRQHVKPGQSISERPQGPHNSGGRE
jgi:hypothetical protein